MQKGFFVSKVVKSKITKVEYEILPQEGPFLIPVRAAKQMGFNTDKVPHYFNDEGSICIVANRTYELHRNGKLISEHASKEEAQKNLEKDWSYE
jgi:hypothetical protein